MNKIKLLVLDVDGVLTDGKKYYGIDGMPFAKTFCDKDWTSIKRFRALGVDVVFLTGDQKINEAIGKNRNISVYLSRGKNKADFLDQLEQEYKCKRINMCYVGDDLFDIDIMRSVGYALCPYDSPLLVKQCCNIVLNSVGGNNVILELFEVLENLELIERVSFEDIMIKIEELDKKENF